MDQQQQYIPVPIRNVILTHEPIIGCFEYLGYLTTMDENFAKTPEHRILWMDILCKIITSTDVLGVAKDIELSESGKEFVKYLYDVTAKYCYVHIEGDNKFLVVKQNENLIDFFVEIMRKIYEPRYTRIDAMVDIMSVIASDKIIENKKGFTQQVNFLLGIILKYVISNKFKKDLEGEKSPDSGSMMFESIEDFEKAFLGNLHNAVEKLKKNTDDTYAINSFYFPLPEIIKSVVTDHCIQFI